jgi:hypothetical protein
MSDNVTQFPEPTKPPEFLVGPFERYKVLIEGRVIPGLTAQPHDDAVTLIVDERFGVTFPKAIALDAAWLIAQALAVGSGYSSLSAEIPGRPFAPIGGEIEQ